MLQTNLIFGIHKQIKEGRAAKNQGRGQGGMLEESDQLVEASPKKEVLLENYHNPSLISGIYEQTKKSQRQTAQKQVLMTEAFHLSKVKKKLNKDISYFNYLYENFVSENFQEDFQLLLENIFEDTIRLYQECDVTPRVISPAIDSNELTENQIVDLYKNSLNKSIKDNYTKPLLSGKITELFESEIRLLTTKLVEEGVTADIEQVRVYLPFEETVYRFNREVIIPKIAQSRIESYMESTTSEYTDLLEESAEDIMKSIEKKIKLLTSMVSPDMFNKVVDADGVNAPKMAGISIAVDKNFNDDDGDLNDDGDICPMEAAAMDPEAAEELDAEDEAEELDAEGEDIVGAEEEAKDGLGQASSSEDLESSAAEDAAELSASENSSDDDQPGAIEKDLPSESASLGAGGHADNTSDVDLQGKGYDNGVDVQSLNATLPGSSTPGSTQDVASDGSGSSDKDLSADAGTVSMDVETSIDTDNEPSVNDDDVSLSAGAGTISSDEISADKEEIIGNDGDNNNPIGGEMVDKEDDEVNTETPSEDEMDSKDEEGAIEDSSLPIPSL